MDARNEGRVYVRRRGRSTAAQERALVELAPRYVVTPPTHGRGWDEAFGRAGPLLVEIGFGMGDALAAFASAHADWNCVGIEVYRPGIGALMLACEREELANVRIVEAEAMTVLRRHRAASMNRIHAFFPDPWPKKRHHKRRLVNAEFAQEAARCLVPDGVLALATDWREYAEQMLLTFETFPALDGGETGRPPERPQTPFETKGAAAGHHITDLAYRRI
ncbi:MAG: tRNA (guanosine(46)-N7)-methyltransferase TrmB [Gammaproteobacteria bacterium]|nr:tRNA (guanosine(46)-N7)-methyltransferase TrmB [Gammaproteobacteria bacterium]